LNLQELRLLSIPWPVCADSAGGSLATAARVKRLGILLQFQSLHQSAVTPTFV